jgi:hypothetical protein
MEGCFTEGSTVLSGFRKPRELHYSFLRLEAKILELPVSEMH